MNKHSAQDVKPELQYTSSLSEKLAPQSHLEPTNEEPSTSTPMEEEKYITGFKLAIVITAVTLVFFLVMLDTSIIATAVPRITSDFHSLPDVGWYGSAYLLASCSLQPLTGKFYTFFHTKYTFLTFLALFELGSLICGLSVSSDMFIVGRAVAGMGCSGLANGALTIIAACVPLEKRPLFMGFMMSVAQIGLVLGPLFGGLLTEYSTWRWCFYINLPAGAMVAVLLFLIHVPQQTIGIKKKSTVRERLMELDLLGFVVFAPAAIQFLLALQWGGTRFPWNSATVIGLFCGAGGTFCVFLVVEYRRGDMAMIPLEMLRQRIVWSSCLVMLFLAGAMYINSYYLPIYFQAVKDATPTMSGVYTLPSVLGQVIFAVVSGVLVSKLGYYLPWSVSSGILTSIGNGLLSTLTPTSSIGTWIGYQIIGGAGRGCGLQMSIVAIQGVLPRDKIPVGMSLAMFCQTLGGALFLSFGQTTFTNGLINALREYAPTVNPETVIAAGAGAVRSSVPQSDVAGVIHAYSDAVSHDYYLAAGASVATFVLCWGMGWKSVKKSKVTETKEGEKA